MWFRRAWIPVSAAMICGIAIGWFFNNKQPVFAGSNTDRYEDFIMATGPINQTLSSNNNNNQFLNAELDGVWVLDYKSGKLLASTINRVSGKMVGFGEVDLVKEFEIAPRANVHFIMSTGNVVRGQSVLYLMETSTGKMGVYSMISSEAISGGNGVERILIRRHDMTSVRTGAMPPPVSTQQLPAQPSIPPMNLPPNQYTIPPAIQQGPGNGVQQTGLNQPNK